ncbi:DUF4097 family beta strand repeat-containing protein [Thalassobacillus pellis]|uniref:DUF4097 family beta strand repeat-containing protein n=1 Tax=Thalassobacillus pellis TaxID=748008 RepID=UPI0019614522|nr:DUF4097 domain-containing protein [Thalassobacillus pellis]MBM7551391.1 DUF4097 and DUF4098 domain-containing protein YvlB [Thalassobacillus pellis]
MEQEKLQVLKMIEEGTITAEEGAERLKQLEHSVSTEVKWEGRDKQSEQKQAPKKKRKLFGYMEQAFTKLKTADLDLNFGEYTVVSHIFQNEGDPFDNIAVSVPNGSLEVKSWKEPSVRLECEAKVYQTEDSNKARQQFLNDVDFKVADESLHFALTSKKMKVDITLYVPEQQYQRLFVKLFNGSITAENLSVRDSDLKTTNGSILLDSMTGQNADTETSNGSVQVRKSALENIEADTVNGSVKLSGDFGKVDASAITGSVTCEYYGGKAHTGFFQTTTGSVKVHLPHNVKVDGKLKTSMGSLNCNMDNAKIYKEKKEMVKKELSFTINETHENVYHLEAETKTGSVTVQ